MASETQPCPLNLSPEEQWTLHATLLDRIEKEATDPDSSDPPPLSVYKVFEKLENESTRFTSHERKSISLVLEDALDDDDLPERDRTAMERMIGRLEIRSVSG